MPDDTGAPAEMLRLEDNLPKRPHRREACGQANVQQVVSTSLPRDLPVGTWDVGLCIRSAVTLNLNDYVNGSITVFG